MTDKRLVNVDVNTNIIVHCILITAKETLSFGIGIMWGE